MDSDFLYTLQCLYMRLGRFEAKGHKPLGVGEHKEVFVNPNNPERVIAEIKAGEEEPKYSPQLLKGTYYLTKIAHLLLPRHVPEIYQAGETEDGQQTIDRRRVAHTPGHEALQAARQSGRDTESARKQIVHEMGADMTNIDQALEDIGLGFAVDGNVGNYTKDEKGDTYYLDTFRPWGAGLEDSGMIQLLFDEEMLRGAIDRLEDQATRDRCMVYLERVQVLFVEEQNELREKNGLLLKEGASLIQKIETLLAKYGEKHDIEALSAIQTEEDALKSNARKAAYADLEPILSRIRLLKPDIDITQVHLSELFGKYRKLACAVGTVHRGQVDHTR